MRTSYMIDIGTAEFETANRGPLKLTKNTAQLLSFFYTRIQVHQSSVQSFINL